MTKPKLKWLDRSVALPGPFLLLCLSQEECDEAYAWLKVPAKAPFVNPGVDATTHHLESTSGSRAAIVGLAPSWRERTSIEVAALLVHEAVHIWQEHRRWLGEGNPGSEQEAYAIQLISETLFKELARRIESDPALHA